MIVPMRKYAILAFHNDFENFLEQLQSFGVADISRRSRPLEDDEMEMVANLSRYSNAIRYFKLHKDQGVLLSEKHLSGEQVLESYESLVVEKEYLEQQVKSIEKELVEIAVWGNLNPKDIDRIKQLGYTPKFYSCSRGLFSPDWERKYAIYPLSEDKNHVYFVALLRKNEVFTLEAHELKVPTSSYAKRQSDLTGVLEQREKNARELAKLASYVSELEKAKAELMNGIDYTDVKCSAESYSDDKIMMLTAWVPEDQNDELIGFLEKQQVVYLDQPIDETENVPIKLRNGWFARLFEPITEMYSLPNYHELDVTAFVAPFYMLFFGFCFGDAGYGLLLVLLGFLIKPKLRKDFRPFVSLIQFLGLAALLVGLFTGSAFGVSLGDIQTDSWLKRYQHLFFNNSESLMILSIALGAVQVLVGMGIKAAKIVKRQGAKYAASKIAWIVLLVAFAAIFGLPAAGVELPDLILYALYGLLGLCLLMIFFYNSPGKNPALNFGVGIWDSFTMTTGLLGDLLSYIRLFALGLTGGILGGAFNEMAMTLPPDIPVVGFLVGFLILIVGHSINIVINMLGALIHPIRLTFVEFFKNAGFEGGGVEYKPFKYNQPKVK